MKEDIVRIEIEDKEKKKEKKYDLEYKLIFLGPSGVGKTSLLLQYSENVFQDIKSTIGVDVRYNYITLENKKIKLDIWDTSGQERYSDVTQSYLNGANGIIFVFDIMNKDSFIKVGDEINKYKTNNIQKDTEIMVVGNKNDIGGGSEISKEDITNFEKNNNVKIYFSSAKNGEGVKDLFEDLVKKLIKHENIGNVNLDDDGDVLSVNNGRNTFTIKEEDNKTTKNNIRVKNNCCVK